MTFGFVLWNWRCASATQAQLAAFGELLHNTAAVPVAARTELRAAARAFDRATRSAVRADHRQATALRAAAKELLAPTARGDESAVAALLSAAVLLAIAAARRHEKHGHQQAGSRSPPGPDPPAHRVRAHLPARPRSPDPPGPRKPRLPGRYEQDLRAAVPEHAERVLADPAWPALTATLATAERNGHRPRHVLAEAAARLAPRTALRRPPGRGPQLAYRSIQPSKRHRAATARSENSARVLRTDVPQQTTPCAPQPDRPNRRQKRR
ncbi:hypothetical protein [Streptomyces spirodelae]|uniref:Uncharacterized protein n=1 Tax=Streptomyces spirodelae TaxID=2812904 RepID=A0ABS3WS57_9ACTN|nr:hypothetical protein [Streptomyces spirodelae]MBO8185959.1 hypothetical protein [Streptomyces spirodelae]